MDAAIPKVLATVSTDPTVTHILPRANWMDDSGPSWSRPFRVFWERSIPKGERATRLDLANWLISRDNPLTARAFVNRFWREFFGIGISKTLDDLGSQGEWPTHPELLDWLAANSCTRSWARRRHDWDVRHIIRLIVTSHTYRQSSLPDAASQAKDPENRLLAQQNRFRVDAENVRDIALEVSGLLQRSLAAPA